MSTVGGHALFAILGPGSGANPESGFGWDRVAPSEHCRCPPTERLCLARGPCEAAWHRRRARSRSAETVLDTRFLKPRMEASTRGRLPRKILGPLRTLMRPTRGGSGPVARPRPPGACWLTRGYLVDPANGIGVGGEGSLSDSNLLVYCLLQVRRGV
ncbi:hypothetical protein WMY93_029753 [Mugilogobius chulae]|uniref:Uncharacterized protein n=1 Tax=Mugilogobius chulae TaxID=88201 RepID=A0AAW0MWN9_9GOBI